MRITITLLVIYSLLACQSDRSGEEIKPRLSNVQESVYGSVTVRPETSYFPQSRHSGIIKEILVERGEELRTGQTLFRIVASDANTRLIDAQLDLAKAKDNLFGENSLLNTTQLDIETEQEQMELDSVNLARQQRLRSKNIGAQIELDRAILKFEQTKNRYQALQNKYAQMHQDLENQYKKAVNMANNERRVLREYTIEAQMDGRIYDIFKEVGEVIHPQDQFAEIGTMDSFILELDIDEVDITRIDLGDTAIIALEAYPDQVFMSLLARIHPKKNERTQTFTVEAAFLEKPPKLYYGLSGEANIIVAKRYDVMTIPTEYLIRTNRVRTLEGEKIIVAGIKNMSFVEIISGIDTATILIKPDRK